VTSCLYMDAQGLNACVILATVNNNAMSVMSVWLVHVKTFI